MSCNARILRWIPGLVSRRERCHPVAAGGIPEGWLKRTWTRGAMLPSHISSTTFMLSRAAETLAISETKSRFLSGHASAAADTALAAPASKREHASKCCRMQSALNAGDFGAPGPNASVQENVSIRALAGLLEASSSIMRLPVCTCTQRKAVATDALQIGRTRAS
jgi:hypothetical protein